METPSQTLARKIIQRLVQEKLITEQDGEKLLTLLSSGKLRSQDWRLPIELSEAKEDKL